MGQSEDSQPELVVALEVAQTKPAMALEEKVVQAYGGDDDVGKTNRYYIQRPLLAFTKPPYIKIKDAYESILEIYSLF